MMEQTRLCLALAFARASPVIPTYARKLARKSVPRDLRFIDQLAMLTDAVADRCHDRALICGHARGYFLQRARESVVGFRSGFAEHIVDHADDRIEHFDCITRMLGERRVEIFALLLQPERNPPLNPTPIKALAQLRLGFQPRWQLASIVRVPRNSAALSNRKRRLRSRGRAALV
jgi:hypothetical protein